MDFHAHIDGYCERLDPSFWAEPVNAVTNAAFLIAALWMWGRAPFPICRILAAVLAAIGVGSFLFHTFATVWAAIADVAPIGIFILVYIWAAHRHFWGLSPLWATISTAGFLPFAAITAPVFGALPFFEVSAAYWPVALLIALEAVFLRHRAPRVALGLGIGAGILCLSLTARSIDETLCDVVPMGTHFLWHILNGIMLGWMIEVLRRHLLEPQPARG